MHKMGGEDPRKPINKRRLTENEIELIGSNYPNYDKYPDAESVYKEVGGELSIKNI